MGAKRRANLRPVGTFFNTANFQVPPSAGRLSKRLVKNVDYFQSNYVLVFLILVLYCLISSPLLLIVIAGAGGAAYFAAVKNETRKIAIAGHEGTLAQQYAAIATASIPFFLLAGAGGLSSGCLAPPCSSSRRTLPSITTTPSRCRRTKSSLSVPSLRRSNKKRIWFLKGKDDC